MKHIQRPETLKELKNPKTDSEEGTNSKSQKSLPGNKVQIKNQRCSISIQVAPLAKQDIAPEERHKQIRQLQTMIKNQEKKAYRLSHSNEHPKGKDV